jgi:hypothetical protein
VFWSACGRAQRRRRFGSAWRCESLRNTRRETNSLSISSTAINEESAAGTSPHLEPMAVARSVAVSGSGWDVRRGANFVHVAPSIQLAAIVKIGIVAADQPQRKISLHANGGHRDGRLAQRLARLLYTQNVGGSNPSSPTIFHRFSNSARSNRTSGNACGLTLSPIRRTVFSP